MLRRVLVLGLLVSLTGCLATRKVDQHPTLLAEGDRAIIVDAPRLPWVTEIEKRLREKGFTVLRGASRVSTSRGAVPNSTEASAISAKYVLEIDGYAHLDAFRRCFGGGFRFEYLQADLIDINTGDVIVSISDSGYSEGCPPAPSNLFENVVTSIARAWR